MSINQEMARKCYEDSRKTRRQITYYVAASKTSIDTELDPRLVHSEKRPQPVGEVKEVIIGGKKFKVGGNLSSTMEAQIIQVFQANLSSFAWTTTNMVGINPDFLCHKLNVNPAVKAKVQGCRRLGGE